MGIAVHKLRAKGFKDTDAPKDEDKAAP
jgi:hypothetical protein